MDTASAAPTARSSRTSTALLILAALTFFSFGFRTISNSSVWMHLASGRHIAQQGIPDQDPFSFTTNVERTWVNPHWLYDAALYRIWEASGPTGAVLFHAALVLLAFLLTLAANRHTGSLMPSAATLLVCGWLIAPVYQIGPAIPALALAGLAVFVLERKGGRPLTWLILIPLQLLWTNVHGSFLLAPLLVLAFAVQEWVVARRDTSSAAPGLPRALLGLAAALAACTLINPYGLGLHRQVLATITQPSLGVLIEWVSPFQSEFTVSPARHASTVVLILVAIGFVFVRERLPIGSTILAVIGALLLVLSPRYVAFSGLLVAPFIALSLLGLSRVIQQRQSDDTQLDPSLVRAGQILLLLACLFTLLFVTTNRYFLRSGSASSFGAGVNTEMLPEAACERVMARADFPERAINLAMDGGYLAWKLPGRKVFTDTRVAVYGALFYQGLARGLLGQPETWTNLMERWQPGAVILNCSWPGAGATARRLVDEKQWALIYFDGISAILVLRTTEHRALISDLEVQRAGLTDLEQSRQAYAKSENLLVRPPIPPRLLGAGAVYLALWRFQEAASIYTLITPRVPAFVTGWLNLGICHFQQKKFDAAVEDLTQARSLRPESTLAWLWLSKAYKVKGLESESTRALQKARSLNATMADAFEQEGRPSTNTPMPGVLDPAKR